MMLTYSSDAKPLTHRGLDVFVWSIILLLNSHLISVSWVSHHKIQSNIVYADWPVFFYLCKICEAVIKQKTCFTVHYIQNHKLTNGQGYLHCVLWTHLKSVWGSTDFWFRNTHVCDGVQRLLFSGIMSHLYWSFHLLHLITDMSFIRTKLSVSYRKGAALIKICRLIDEYLWLLSKA